MEYVIKTGQPSLGGRSVHAQLLRSIVEIIIQYIAELASECEAKAPV